MYSIQEFLLGFLLELAHSLGFKAVEIRSYSIMKLVLLGYCSQDFKGSLQGLTIMFLA